MVAIFEEICRRRPEIVTGVRRTLERRIGKWRALYGPSRDVIFRQEHPPGRIGLSDFTDMSALGIMIAGTRFDLLLCRFRGTGCNSAASALQPYFIRAPLIGYQTSKDASLVA